MHRETACRMELDPTNWGIQPLDQRIYSKFTTASRVEFIYGLSMDLRLELELGLGRVALQTSIF